VTGGLGCGVIARDRELSFVGLQRDSRAREACFGFVVVKDRKFSALRLPFIDRRRERDGSVADDAGMLSEFGASD